MTASGLGTSPSDGVCGGMVSFELGGIDPAGCRLAAAASVERSLSLKKAADQSSCVYSVIVSLFSRIIR